MRLIFDLESDGLYDDKINKDGTVSPAATQIWCIVTKDIDTGQVLKFLPDQIEVGLIHMESANELIGHNIIDYDLRLIMRLYSQFNPKSLILDTLILSQLLNPDRKGGHSLGQYGEELGHKKPEHEDWSQFSPEMLHRCTEDVEINHKVYDKLMSEAYEGVQGYEYHKIFTNSL